LFERKIFIFVEQVRTSCHYLAPYRLKIPAKVVIARRSTVFWLNDVAISFRKLFKKELKR